LSRFAVFAEMVLSPRSDSISIANLSSRRSQAIGGIRCIAYAVVILCLLIAGCGQHDYQA
jgi:hypothetical protein